MPEVCPANMQASSACIQRMYQVTFWTSNLSKRPKFSPFGCNISPGSQYLKAGRSSVCCLSCCYTF
ncbi:unnamed protein product [Rhodiola kirilowii]